MITGVETSSKDKQDEGVLFYELLEVNPSHDIMTLVSLEKATASWLSQANQLLSKHDPQTLL